MIAALLAVLAPASPSASPASVPSAVAIFDRAFARLGSYPVAPYVVFVATRSERITSPIPGAASSRNFVVRYALRSSDGGENAAMYPLPGSGLPPALIVTSDEGP
ncbi:MAG TPA: hypothetical protein VNG31_05795, partial [Candidatus Baltobacteraceae bacterium]|nr:hypothetical protein [Candidatus Baltobacteraceae bacterium]